MYIVNRHIALFIFLLKASIFVLAQNPYTIELNKEKGLPSNKVYDLKEDKKGFIWIASDEGLSRYNGSSFKTFKSFSQSSTPGSCINEDGFGRIFYENFDGYLYYVENDSLYAIPQNKPAQYVPYGINNEFLFVVQQKGIDIFKLKNFELVKTIDIPVIEVEHACIFNNDYYIFSSDMLYKINQDLSVEKTDVFSENGELVKQLYVQENNLYVISKLNENKKLYIIDGQLNINHIIYIPEVEFIQSSSFIDNAYWMNTSNGTYVYGQNGKLLKHYFINTSISAVIKDYQQNYWISTTNEGIKIIPDLNNQLFETNNFIPSKIIEYNNQFLIAGKNGNVYLTNSSFTEFKNIYSPNEKSEIHYLYYDSLYNKIYIASKGVSVLDGTTFKPQSFEFFAVKSLSRIDSSYIAFAASSISGLIKTANYPSQFDSIFNNGIPSHSKYYKGIFENNRGKTVTFTKENNTIYYGTNTGLYLKNNFQTKEITQNGNTFYASKLIFAKQILYALSTKGNLYAIHKDSIFEILNSKVGLKEFEIRNFKYIDNKLYILNNKSIHEFDIEKNSSRKIKPASTSFEINDFTVYNKQLIVLTKIGIIKFHIDEVQPKVEPKFHLINVQAGNKYIHDYNSITELEHFQNSISIQFSILDYGEKSYDKIFYQINNDELIELPENSNHLDLPLLAAGDYQIDFYLDTKKTRPTLKFKILQPIWKRWWFITIFILIILAIIYTYYNYQVGLLRKQVKLLNEKVKLEHNLHKSIMKAIKLQMNPHFFYNALNTIQAFIFTNDKAKANMYLAKFSKLTRLILEQSEKETITLAEEINTLQLYLELEKMRFNNDFDYVISEEGILNKELIELPPMLIQPYVENAVKHGLLHKENDRKLSIVFSVIDQLLIITIDDNGIGRKKAEELKKIKEEKFASFSTHANEKRLEIINHSAGSRMGVEITDKYDEAQNPEGTRVVLTIPIN